MDDNNFNDFLNPGYRIKKSGLTKQQIELLTSIYMVNKKPTTFQRQEIAQRLGVNEDKIKNWFQNRRAKDKKLLREKSSILIDLNDCDVDLQGLYPSCNDLYRRRWKK